MKSGDKRKSHLNFLGKYLSKSTKLKLLNNLGEQNSRLQIDKSVINIKVAMRRKKITIFVSRLQIDKCWRNVSLKLLQDERCA